MTHLTDRQRMFIWVFGGMIGTVALVVPLIAYGFVASNSDFTYPQTVCRYDGYYIKHNLCGGSSKPFGGFLEFEYRIYNKSNILRSVQTICDQTKTKIQKYFDKHYNNSTVWACWYDRANPADGWFGFSPPYDVNGKAMVATGFIIFFVFVFMIATYLIIQRKRYGGYFEINSNYDSMIL